MVRDVDRLGALSAQRTRPVSRLDVALVALPLVVAIFNPGTGWASGMYATIYVFALMALRHGIALAPSLKALDVLIGLSGAVVLLSPLWATVPSVESLSPSRGATVSVAYMLLLRWLVLTEENLLLYLKIISLVTFGYAVYFLGNAHVVPDTQRMTVSFANANYTGAVLTFGVAVAAWLWLARRGSWIWLLAAVVQGVAVYGTGSRASFAGAVLASAVLLLGPMASTWAHRLVYVVLVGGFLVGLYPGSAALFRALSQPLGDVSAFSRDPTAILSVSGRETIWMETREVVSQSWLFGWGPDRYRMLTAGQSPAHSWGLEWIASVGLFGTAFLATVVTMAYFCRGQLDNRMPGRDGRLLNAATAFALAPNLVLSTHQWTLWAFAGFAVWSRAFLLTDVECPKRRVASCLEGAGDTAKQRGRLLSSPPDWSSQLPASRRKDRLSE
jgi:hypothetical protein